MARSGTKLARVSRSCAWALSPKYADQASQFQGRGAESLHVPLSIAVPDQSCAGDQRVAMDVQTGVVWMKYLHTPLLRRSAGEEPTGANSNMRAPALVGSTTIRDARGVSSDVNRELRGAKFI